MAGPADAESVWERAARLAGQVTGQAEAFAELAVPPEQRDVVRRVMALSFPDKLGLGWKLLRDPSTGDPARFLLFFTAAYGVLPVRLGPARLRPLRRLEKLVILPALTLAILRLTPAGVLEGHLPPEE